MDTIKVNNRSIPFEVRRSARAKRLRLQIEADKPQLVLVIPQFVMSFQINSFLKKQESWIDKNWSKIEKSSAKRPKHTYADGDTFYYFGEALSLRLIPSLRWRPRTRVNGNTLEIALHKATTQAESKKIIKKAIEDFYKAKASEVIHDRLQFFNEYYRLEYKRVTFRNQKTRWGSCSSAKNLNFNWRLIMAPIGIIDYVVVHELCHLKQMNHSAAFWKLVAEQISDHKECRKWLKDNSFLLSF